MVEAVPTMDKELNFFPGFLCELEERKISGEIDTLVYIEE